MSLFFITPPPKPKGVISIYGMGEFRFLGALTLVLHECIWNAPAVSLVFPAFDDNGSLGSPLGWVVYLMVPPSVTASYSLARSGGLG